jgi:hypothetical protein
LVVHYSLEIIDWFHARQVRSAFAVQIEELSRKLTELDKPSGHRE